MINGMYARKSRGAALSRAIIGNRIGASDQGHARLSHAGVTLILVAGFMLGVLISHVRRHGVSRRMEDLRAALSLTAGVLLILMVFGFVHVPDTGRIHDFRR